MHPWSSESQSGKRLSKSSSSSYSRRPPNPSRSGWGTTSEQDEQTEDDHFSGQGLTRNASMATRTEEAQTRSISQECGQFPAGNFASGPWQARSMQQDRMILSSDQIPARAFVPSLGVDKSAPVDQTRPRSIEQHYQFSAGAFVPESWQDRTGQEEQTGPRFREGYRQTTASSFDRNPPPYSLSGVSLSNPPYTSSAGSASLNPDSPALYQTSSEDSSSSGRYYYSDSFAANSNAPHHHAQLANYPYGNNYAETNMRHPQLDWPLEFRSYSTLEQPHPPTYVNQEALPQVQPPNSVSAAGWSGPAGYDRMEDISEEYDNSDSVVIANPRGYFKSGRIFKTTTASSETKVANKDLQTFVVLQEGPDSMVCAPLQLYDAEKPGYSYGGENRPLVFASGATSQLVSKQDPSSTDRFPVFVEGPSVLDPESQIDFSAALEIKHSSKIQNVGRIDRNYVKALKLTFAQITGAGPLDNDDRYIAASKTDTLHKDYKIHRAKDFKFGKIFKLLWTEPKGGEIVRDHGTEIIKTPAIHGEDVYTSVRRFVIFKALEGHCLCLPILTYGRQGTRKQGVKPQDHAIIYTKTKSQLGDKVKGLDSENKLFKKPIRVDALTARDELDLASRLNYAKIYTIEYNIKVRFIGKIHKDSLKYFVRDYNRTHQPLPEQPDVEYSAESADGTP